MPYVGRFAPSPTGRLHLGTLTAAAASFLHARQMGGEWLVRIEDIDPPREVPGAADAILRTLDALALEWDRSVLYQRTRVSAHLAAAERLLESRDAYHCSCSRQRILAATGGRARYPGTCRHRAVHDGATAMRLRVDSAPIRFTDQLQGPVRHDIVAIDGDFVVVRRDGLPAYHLAVVLDDAFQGVTDVVRGADLLECTALHVHLQERMALATPAYWHIPVITNAAGEKLSKGAGATAVDVQRPERAAALALELLGLTLPAELLSAPPAALWAWAIRRWRIESLAGRPHLIAPEP